MHIILASASPRRRELIHQIGWTEEICPSSFLKRRRPKKPARGSENFPKMFVGKSPASKMPDL